MRDRLFSLFGIEPGAERVGSLLLIQSLFLGFFFGAFDVSAHSLFLAIFDEKMMAKGYIASGITGIILTSLYTWFQARINFRYFAIINLIVVTSLTLILWLALILTHAQWIIFIVFIMLGPLNILPMLGFRESTDRLFTRRQGTRVSGLVDAGLIIGIIISCYTIAVLLSFKFESHNILLLGVSSVLIAAIIQIIIGAKFHPLAGRGERLPEKLNEQRSVLTVFREDKYSGIIGIFISLSVITLFFVQYSFMAVTRQQYPAEVDMAIFLGIFTGSLMIFTLLFKLFLFSYLIRKYGLRTCLAISPILVGALTAVAITISLLMDYAPESLSGFIMFFLLLALSRLFSKSMKDSIIYTSFKIICQIFSEKTRHEFFARMEGTWNEIAVLLSGLILTGLGILSFIKLIHFSWILFFINFIWVFVAFRLYIEYRKSIGKTLETTVYSGSSQEIINEKGIITNRFSADRAFRTDYFRLISGDYSELENKKNTWYFEKIIDYYGSKHDISLIPALKKLASDSNLDDEIRRKSDELIKNIGELSYSGEQEDDKIINGKRILSGTRLPQTTEILLLLRDSSIESKRLAIFMIGKFKLSDMLTEVCECLSIPGLETDAAAVLQTFRSDAADELIKYYLVSSGNTNTSKTILGLLGKTCTKESMGFLFSRLWSNSRQLKEVALKCLIDCEFKPSEEDKDRLHMFISDIVGFLTWNLSAKVCLEKSNDTFLLEAMRAEINRWDRFLFDVLSITYDSGSIARIRENLEIETVESVSYALEMIDIVIDESVKTKLISLLDVVPDEEKLKNLYQFYPGEIPQYYKLLEDIINRDYNLLTLWTKACTLRNLQEVEGDDMAESVVALLFSPEGLLQEESAKLVYRSSRELYRSASQRIPDSTKKRLDNIVNGETDEKELVFEKIQFLSNIFQGIPEEELYSLAGAMEYSKDLQTGFPKISSGFIIWTLSDDIHGNDTYIHYTEQLSIPGDRFKDRDNASYYILPFNAIDEFLNQFPERSFEILKYMNNNEEESD